LSFPAFIWQFDHLAPLPSPFTADHPTETPPRQRSQNQRQQRSLGVISGDPIRLEHAALRAPMNQSPLPSPVAIPHLDVVSVIIPRQTLVRSPRSSSRCLL